MDTDIPGKLVVFSGPSGVGKSTVLKGVLAHFPGKLRMSISATTREPRPGETDGVDYHYLSDEEFARRRESGEFLECVEVFGRGHWYGTLQEEVRPSLEAGEWVILEVDVEGAQKVLAKYPQAITIFLDPGSVEELERRLRSRGTESEEAIQRRLSVARQELALADRYEHRVINNSIPEAIEGIIQILKSRGLRDD